MHTLEERHRERFVLAAAAAQNLLDVDGAYPRRLGGIAQSPHALRGGLAAQRVDQDRRIEQQPQPLSDTTRIAVALSPDPTGGVAVPFVLTSREGAQAGFDVLPATLVIERSADSLRDERTTVPPSNTLVKALHQLVVKAYV